MKRWTHPQDLVALIAGAYAALSPLWTTTTNKATTTMVVLGAITAVLALVELVRPDMLSIEGLTALLGVLMIAAPWVLGLSSTRPISWTAWIVGAVVLVVGAADLQVTRSHHRDTMATSH
jgi:chromate transport protein ChrA